ncbi:7419_t:CDS:2 [Ambispora leptoticha]|uniref:7419_t:CDS:1 n=1 Tax=Ambispora leptoticha TaxID=144679 RepID=A0A9N9BJP8_9GLOM|nr:7419_t:CDS:2 [Ambispora leptoticha]
MAGKTFKSIQEELEHYKTRALELEENLAETQAALEEFQQSSKELEEELERELEQSEKMCRDLKTKNEQLKNEVDVWKQKYYQSKSESNINTTQMQRELDSLRSLKEKFMIQTRELELHNDDLERTERAAQSSLMDLENKYNKAIERNVLLENELEGKNQLIVQVQRLKDELRDVNIEMAILKNKQDGEYGPPTAAAVTTYSRPSSAMSVDSPPPSSPTFSSHAQSNPVMMVQEMVGRVKSLEARLVSCRSLVTPLLAPPPSYSTTMPLCTSPPSPVFSKHRADIPYRSPSKPHRRSSAQKKQFMIHTPMFTPTPFQV